MVYIGWMPNFRPLAMVRFSELAVVALPGRITDCEGALLQGNRDAEDRPQILCSFLPGDVVRELPGRVPLASAVLLSAADARALARELERAAEEAEDQ
jgi:hypothetical protein